MGVPLCNSIMRNILYFGVVIAFFASYLQCKPSNLEDIDEEEFEDKFHLPPVNDPVEFKKREEALKGMRQKSKKSTRSMKMESQPGLIRSTSTLTSLKMSLSKKELVQLVLRLDVV